MSLAYDIFKSKIAETKPFEELTENEKKAWLEIDNHLVKKVEIVESPAYELFKSKNKDVKEFCELPDSLKKVWNNIDKNYDKIVKKEIPKPIEKKKTDLKVLKNQSLAKNEKPTKEEKTSLTEKMEALKKLKGK